MIAKYEQFYNIKHFFSYSTTWIVHITCGFITLIVLPMIALKKWKSRNDTTPLLPISHISVKPSNTKITRGQESFELNKIPTILVNDTFEASSETIDQQPNGE